MDGDNASARLLASCWSLVGASAIFLCLRIYCKLWRGRGLWWDDHLMTISWVSLVIAVSIQTYICSLGFGRHIWTVSDENIKTINLNTIIVAAFGIMATSISKTSFALTLYRIIMNKWIRWFLIFVIVSINLAMNLVWIFGLAKCTPFRKVWDSSVEGTCWDRTKLAKFQSFAAYYSSALDFVLAFLPWEVLMGTTMLGREKFGVAVAMSLGAIAGICGIVKAVQVVHITSADVTYDRVDLTIWTLTEPAVTIMAASIPVLRMIYRELKSSSRGYFRSQSNANPYNFGIEGANQEVKKSRRTTRYGNGRQYGRNSVAIVSVRQESQQDLHGGGGRDGIIPPSSAGIVKTEEVQVQHQRLSKMSRRDSFELASLDPTYSKDEGVHDVP